MTLFNIHFKLRLVFVFFADVHLLVTYFSPNTAIGQITSIPTRSFQLHFKNFVICCFTQLNNNFSVMAARHDRESSVNDHFGKLLKFSQRYLLVKYL